MGRLGSISVQLVLSRHEFSSDPGYLRAALAIFSVLMALGAVIAWVWLPDVQGKPKGVAKETTWPILPSKGLEDLAKGRRYAISDEGQIISFRDNIIALFKRWSARRVVLDPSYGLGGIDAGGEQ